MRNCPTENLYSRALLLTGLLLAIGALSACSESAPNLPTVTLAPPTSAPATTTAPTSTTTVEGAAPIEVDTISVAPGDDLAAMVAEAAEGTAFVLESGVHRMHSVWPKDGMSFTGRQGAVMSGAMELDGFTFADPYWQLGGVEIGGFLHGVCLGDYEGCQYPQDLFMDDVMLWQVTELDSLVSGAWYWDGEQILVADDPGARRVELSVTDYAFVGAADDVTIKDLRVEKYATPAQAGSVQAQEPGDGERGQRWVIEDVEVSGSHGVGIRAGDHTRITRVYVHHNGQMGVTVSGGEGVILEDSEIAFNNTAGFDWAWEAGGLKATQCIGLIVRGNHAHNNLGPGLWTDIDAVDTLYEDNLVADNGGVGIFHEISEAAIIRGNTVERNGFAKPEWLWGAGILIAASSDVEVYDNVVLDNADGIAGIQQERGSGPYGRYLLENVFVHDNTVRMQTGQTGVVEDVGDDAVFSERNIVFSSNTYLDSTGRRFMWDGGSLDQGGWLSIGQGEGSRWETSP